MRKVKAQALRKLTKKTEGGFNKRKYRLMKKRYNTMTQEQRSHI